MPAQKVIKTRPTHYEDMIAYKNAQGIKTSSKVLTGVQQAESHQLAAASKMQTKASLVGGTT